MLTVRKDIFLAKDEYIPSSQMAGPIYVLNLIALIIAIIFCLFLCRII